MDSTKTQSVHKATEEDMKLDKAFSLMARSATEYDGYDIQWDLDCG